MLANVDIASGEKKAGRLLFKVDDVAEKKYWKFQRTMELFWTMQLHRMFLAAFL